MNCASCRFSHEEKDVLYCRRFPPQYAGRDQSNPENMWFFFPTVNPKAACGEMKPKAENLQ